jgi:hypothetical protein
MSALRLDRGVALGLAGSPADGLGEKSAASVAAGQSPPRIYAFISSGRLLVFASNLAGKINMSDVVSLRGQPIISPGEVNPEVVELAEKLLNMAHSGEINALVALAIHSDDATSTFRRGSLTYRLVGSMTVMLHEICAGL